MALYPGALPGFLTVKNFIKVDTDGAISAGDTTIPLVDASALPTGGGFLVADNETLEIIKYAGVSGNNLTGVTRGADGSSASAQPDSTNFEMRWNAGYYNDLGGEIIAIATDLRNSFSIDLVETAPAATASNVAQRFGHIAQALINITGEADWKTVPSDTLLTLRTAVDGKVSKAGDTMTGSLTMQAGITLESENNITFQDADNSHNFKIKPATAISASYTLTFPTQLGVANSVFISDASGNLSLGLIANANVDASAAITYSKLDLTGGIVNADVNASAAIQYSKMETLTASRMLVSNGSGLLVPSGWIYSVTATDWLETANGVGIYFWDNDGSNRIGVRAPNDVTANWSFLLPADGGSTNEVLVRTGAGSDWEFITDNNIDASAAIALTKLAAATADRLPRFDGSGFLVASNWVFDSSNHLQTGSEQQIRFQDSTTNYVALKAPSSVTTYSIIWPGAQGAVDTYLKNDGAGNLSWVTIGGGGGGTVSAGLISELAYYPANGNTVNGAIDALMNPAAYNANANRLVLRSSSGATGLTIKANTNSLCHIGFTDAEGTTLQGLITYSHNVTASAETLNFRLAETDYHSFDGAGRVAFGTQNISSYNVNADNFIVAASSGAVGMTIRSGANSAGIIGFTDAEGTALPGLIQYNHNATEGNETMTFQAANVSDVLTLGANLATFTIRGIFPNGAVGSPGVGNASFAGGIFWPNTDQITITPDGSAQFNLTATQVRCSPNGALVLGAPGNAFGGLTVSNGSAAVPSINFDSWPTTGFSARATNVLTVSCAGATVFEFQPGNLIALTHMRIFSGTSESQVGLSFSADQQQGLYRVGTNIWGLTNQGSLRLTFSSGSLLVQSKFLVDEDGIFTAANPPFAFANDSDTGLANTAANNLDLVTTGVSRWRIDSSGRLVSANGQAIYAGNGSVSAPSVAFNNDPNNGMYYISTDRWGLAAGGALIIDISQNSVLPGADNGITLGNASFRWSDLRSVLINGADYGFENGWIMREYPADYNDVQTKSPQWMKENAWKGIQVLNKEGETVFRMEHDGYVYAKGFRTFDGFDFKVRIEDNTKRIESLEKELKELKEAA